MTELEVLIEQLDELLGEGAQDEDDALEIAMVAGLAARLGAPRDAMAAAEAWREENADLLEAAFDEIELDELVEAIDQVIDGVATEEEIEDALYDFDEVVAAAVWSGHTGAVRRYAREVAKTIRTVPDTFAPIADVGVTMARLPSVGEHYDLYDYWMAVADAAEA